MYRSVLHCSESTHWCKHSWYLHRHIMIIVLWRMSLMQRKGRGTVNIEILFITLNKVKQSFLYVWGQGVLNTGWTYQLFLKLSATFSKIHWLRKTLMLVPGKSKFVVPHDVQCFFYDHLLSLMHYHESDTFNWQFNCYIYFACKLIRWEVMLTVKWM